VIARREVSMFDTARRFSPGVVAALDEGKILAIRAGSTRHRFIGVWPVIVDGRLFVRSWGVKPDGWYHAFRAEPTGTIRVGERQVRVRAVPRRGERVLVAVDKAYKTKYQTPGALRYVRDFCRAPSRATTTELIPIAREQRARVEPSARRARKSGQRVARTAKPNDQRHR
jgi:hypothetical protein